MAKNGVTNGLVRYATTDQSKVKDKMPSPFWPDPSWWANTDFRNAKQRTETVDKVLKR